MKKLVLVFLAFVLVVVFWGRFPSDRIDFPLPNGGGFFLQTPWVEMYQYHALDGTVREYGRDELAKIDRECGFPRSERLGYLAMKGFTGGTMPVYNSVPKINNGYFLIGGHEYLLIGLTPVALQPVDKNFRSIHDFPKMAPENFHYTGLAIYPRCYVFPPGGKKEVDRIFFQINRFFQSSK